jgi:hypothetical protein
MDTYFEKKGSPEWSTHSVIVRLITRTAYIALSALLGAALLRRFHRPHRRLGRLPPGVRIGAPHASHGTSSSLLISKLKFPKHSSLVLIVAAKMLQLYQNSSHCAIEEAHIAANPKYFAGERKDLREAATWHGTGGW